MYRLISPSSPPSQGPRFFFRLPIPDNADVLRSVLTRPAGFPGSELDWQGNPNVGAVLGDLPQFLEANPNVTTLNFSNCSLTGDQLDEVLAIVAKHRQVTVLKLDNNVLNEQPSTHLCKVFNDNDLSHLNDLSLSFMRSSERGESFSAGQFNDRVLQILGKATNLQKLALNRMGMEELSFKESVLPVLPQSLTDLSLNANFLYAPSIILLVAETSIGHINLRESRITIMDAYSIYDEFARNGQIQSLDISQIGLRPTPLRAMQEGLRAKMVRDDQREDDIPDHFKALLSQDSNGIFDDQSRFMLDPNAEDEGAQTDFSWQGLAQLEQASLQDGRTFNVGAFNALSDYFSQD